MTRFYKLLFFYIIIFPSCKEEERSDLEDKVLVESFVHFGNESNKLEIRLFSPLSKHKESPLVTPQNTQIKNLTKNLVTFPEYVETGVFLINSEDLNFEIGDNIQLLINYQRNTITAVTTIPTRTENIELSEANLKINYVVDAIPERIILTWSSEENSDYYLITIDTASHNPQKIEDKRIGFDTDNPYLDINKIGVPFQGNSIEISYPAATHFGKHRLILYHISKEYFDLYTNPIQGSYNKLNQSVINGLGIFTALNSDTIYFRVIH